MNPIYPKEGTQERRVLDALLDANGGWVNKQLFIRSMFLTQSGRAIHSLENRFHWNIEHSSFTDEHGFKSYRIPRHAQAARIRLNKYSDRLLHRLHLSPRTLES